MSKWYDIGVKAGKTEGWMNLEGTLAEDLERHSIRDVEELVQRGIDNWEETDHFSILYGQKMLDDAREDAGEDENAWPDLYSDNKTEFWEGYLFGRKSIGRDVYAKAKELLAPKTKPETKKRKPSKRRKPVSTGVRTLR